jgi:hypothetical protein
MIVIFLYGFMKFEWCFPYPLIDCKTRVFLFDLLCARVLVIGMSPDTRDHSLIGCACWNCYLITFRGLYQNLQLSSSLYDAPFCVSIVRVTAFTPENKIFILSKQMVSWNLDLIILRNKIVTKIKHSSKKTIISIISSHSFLSIDLMKTIHLHPHHYQ